jgi:hypothetical protein
MTNPANANAKPEAKPEAPDLAAILARLEAAEARAASAEARAAKTAETGARQWAAKPIPEAMIGFTAWIAETYPEFAASVDFDAEVTARLVTVASKAYKYYQATR